MRSPLVAFSLVIVAISASGCVTTSADGVRQVSHDKSVTSGHRERVGRAWHINPDCSTAGAPTIRVVEPPTHGKLTLVAEKEALTGAKGGFAKCNSTKQSMIDYYYQSSPGYSGSDTFTLRISFGNGTVKDSVTGIQVQK